MSKHGNAPMPSGLRYSERELWRDVNGWPDVVRDVIARVGRMREENRRLRGALEAAADDLGKAANQFASIHESQQYGHYPDIRQNHHKFAAKEARARAVLTGELDAA